MNQVTILPRAISQLAEYHQWVTWRYEERDGKRTKVPKNPHTGFNSSSTDPETWGSYEQALAAKELYGHDGIGFNLWPETVLLVGVDVDNCIDESGNPNELAQKIIVQADSYTEISPSGKGIRIFAFGVLPEGGRKKPKLGVEMYVTGRFFTVTGDHLKGTPDHISNRTPQLAQLHEMIFGKPQPKAEPKTPGQIDNLGDQALIERIRKSEQGAKFDNLWAGDISNYPSHSEADQAMVNILYWWSQGDEEQVKRLFAQSGLKRDKWDRVDYQERTIAKAASNGNVRDPGYNGNGSGASAQVSHGTHFEAEPVADHQTEEIKAEPTWADLEEILGPVEWDWPPWLAKGFQTLVVANSGEGKSNLILRTAQSYLIGSPWPDGSPFTGETGKVLWCETEAAQALNLDRAKKWGLPLEKVITPLSPLDNVSLDNPEHQGAIYSKARQPEVKLIVVDSLSGGTRKSNAKNSEMLVVGGFLAELARDTGKPVLVSHHLRKKNAFDTDIVDLDRVRDSSTIVQLARVIWAIDTPDVELKDRKRLYVIKNNLRKFPEPIGFEVTESGLDFGEAPKPPRKETQADKAADLLLILLAKEPKTQDYIKAEAEGAGISMVTIKRAKAKLNIVSKKMGTVWYWSLPSINKNI